MSMRAAVTSMASAQPSARSTSLNFRITRELLKHKDSYNHSIRPFLQGLSSHTHGVLRYLPPHLLNLCRDESTKKFLPLEDVLRKKIPEAAPTPSSSKRILSPGSKATSASSPGSSTAAAIEMAQQLQQPDPQVALGMEALTTFNLLHERLMMTDHKSLLDVPYEFNVGDLVVHKDLRQLGVVAARLPVCLESESWVIENIGSMSDRRMAHPWYLILVAHHAGLPLDFVRYGSQLTHTKMADSACKPIGFHRLLPLYFQGYNLDDGCYIPRGKLPPKPEVVQEQSEEEKLRATAADVVDDDAVVPEAEVVAEHVTPQSSSTPSTTHVPTAASTSF